MKCTKPWSHVFNPQDKGWFLFDITWVLSTEASKQMATLRSSVCRDQWQICFTDLVIWPACDWQQHSHTIVIISNLIMTKIFDNSSLVECLSVLESRPGRALLDVYLFFEPNEGVDQQQTDSEYPGNCMTTIWFDFYTFTLYTWRDDLVG